MSQSVWGPPVWTLFHTFIEKIKDEHYTNIAPQLFFYIKRISSVLPCPECSQHATTFWSKVDFNNIKNRNDFRNLIYIFHNIVNVKKGKPVFRVSDLEQYKNKNLIIIYNHFVSVYNTKGNMNLLADSFQRKILLGNFKRWVMSNINFFNP